MARKFEDIRVTELKARRDELLCAQASRVLSDDEVEELDRVRVELYQMGEKNWAS